MLREEKRCSVTEIYQKLGHAQNLVSHHLTCLKNCGLVTAEKKGKQVYYKLRNKKILKLIDFTDRYIKDVLESVLFCEVVSEENRGRSRTRRSISA
ncbi:MAG TPA: transcriptional regulator [Nitrospiria bacterium]|nr:transcriptional regulator [Candidatus Manganitrophaceae bacterium]HIL34102.1 transcriptional regulator [Candidatus Manganitrophaceae bacterium]